MSKSTIILTLGCAAFLIAFTIWGKNERKTLKLEKQLFIESCVEHEPYYKCIKKYNEL